MEVLDPREGTWDATLAQVRKTLSWPRSWANFSLLSALQLCSHRNAWANLHLLGQPNTFLAAVPRRPSLQRCRLRAGLALDVKFIPTPPCIFH
jgi:hypothetical protein